MFAVSGAQMDNGVAPSAVERAFFITLLSTEIFDPPQLRSSMEPPLLLVC
jgi:hypothetical protein